MLMTPARQQRKASKTCKPNWRNKKQPAAVAPRKGNCATGCHFRPYSFASSPFDDFADMKNITRKTVCQGVSAPPHGRPPTTGCINSPKGRTDTWGEPSDNQKTPRQHAFLQQMSRTRQRAIPSQNPKFRHPYNSLVSRPRTPRLPPLPAVRTHTFRNLWITPPHTSTLLY